MQERHQPTILSLLTSPFLKRRLDRLARCVGDDWKTSDYYKKAESQSWMATFWNEGTHFARLMSRLDLRCVLELACGHGRHSERLRHRAGALILMDINTENVQFCRTRFLDIHNVSCLCNNGYNFLPVTDASCSAIFCYDAMVHFPKEVVLSYLRDTYRVLCPAGMALFHHSNYSGNSGRNYQDNPSWRNFMSQNLFIEYSLSSGLEVVESVVMEWDVKGLLSDCLSLVRKPC
jgi:SAM-dependent methyltransferase